MQQWFAIGLFGLIGIFSRYGLDRWWGASATFPLNTLMINLAGSLLAGLIFALNEREQISPLLNVALLVGFCGGFTTFSAYALQAVLMFDKEKTLVGIAYFILSPTLALAAAALPIFISRRWI